MTDLSEGEFLEEGIGLVGLTEYKIIGNFNLCAGILGCDQHLVGPEVLWVGV